MLQITFTTQQNQSYGSEATSIPLSIMKSNMNFDYPWKEGEYYTFIFVDPDIQDPYYLHYYETNIVASSAERTNIVIPYYPPQQVGHHYTFLLFRQPGKLNDFHISERTGFDLEAEIGDLGLEYLDSKVIVSK